MDSIHGALVLNFVLLYFGQAVPQGDINADNFKAQMLHLGLGYNFWAKAVKHSTRNAVDTNTVMSQAAEVPGYY